MKLPVIEPKFVVGIVAFVLLLLASGQIYRCMHDNLGMSQSIAHVRAELAALDGVAASMRDVENGQRAYIATGETIFIAQREYELAQIRAALRKLNQLTEDDPAQHVRSNTLSQLAEERLQVLAQGVAISRSEGVPIVRNGVLASGAQADSNAFLTQVGEMQEQARRLLKLRNGQSDGNVSEAILFAALLMGSAIMATILLIGRAIGKMQQRPAAARGSYPSHFTFDIARKW